MTQDVIDRVNRLEKSSDMVGIEIRDRRGEIWPEYGQFGENHATSIYGDENDAKVDEDGPSAGMGGTIYANNETNGDSEQSEVHEDGADPDDFDANKDAILVPDVVKIGECDQAHAEIARVPG